ncbi:MAG: ABC transporter permease [Thermoleophilia bacterium]|nr:ABC transporter permease [Thermoleophilia bacterium]
MLGVALKGLGARKLRSALTAIAIVLGVAMVSGTYVLTDTIDKAFNAIFQETYANTDAVVSGEGADISFQGLQAETPPVDGDVLQQVREQPSVETAVGTVYNQFDAKILDEDGKPVGGNGAPTMGFGVDTSGEAARFNPLKLVDGRWAQSDDEVVLDVASAEKAGFEVGDRVRISTLQPAREFEVVGLAQYGTTRSLGSATFAAFTLENAQTLFEREGQYDQIAVAGVAGVSPDELVADLEAALPDGVSVQSGVQQAEDDSSTADFIDFIRYFLLAFAGIALFVGAFVIFNTLSITVAQRTREFATLRTIGGSRRQILTSVIVEALAIGFVASVIGLFAGFGLAIGLQKLFEVFELDLPRAETVFATRTIVVSMLIGTVVTLLAGLFPAIRATRVPPIAAVREGAELPRGRFAPLMPYLALVLLAISIALLAYAMFVDELGTAQRLLSIAGGVLLLFVGVAMLSSRLVRPIAAVVGWPATAIGGAAGRLAKGNSMRNPQRTAATAAALMIGVALVTFVAVLANGMKASNRGAIEDQVKADYVVTAQDGFSLIVGGIGEALAESDEAELVTPVRAEIAKIGGENGYLTGIDPDAIGEVYNFEWAEGSDAVLGDLGRDGAIVSKDLAEKKDLSVGERITLLTATNETARLEVKGIYEPPPFFPLLGNASISRETFDALHDRPRDQYVFANVTGQPAEATTNALARAVADYPDGLVQTREGWITQQDEDFNQFLIFLYVLLALAVIVSLFGMVNTLVLSVFERTRELGMLRAVGMTRRQTRRMIRHESVITALIGATLGVPLGIFLAALVTRALSQFDVQFSVPYGWLVAFAVIAIVVGIIAAIAPARRAARLNVLRALQYE